MKSAFLFVLTVMVSCAVAQEMTQELKQKQKGYDFHSYLPRHDAETKPKVETKPTGETQAELESAKFEQLEDESRSRALKQFDHLYSDPTTGCADYVEDEIILAEAKQDPILNSPDWPEKIFQRVMTKYFKDVTDPFAAMKSAFAAGETIQLWSFERGEWHDVIGDPKWSSQPEMYRIKPKAEEKSAAVIVRQEEWKPVRLPPTAAEIAEWRRQDEAAKPKPDPYVEAMQNMPKILEERRQRETLERIADQIEQQNFILLQAQWAEQLRQKEQMERQLRQRK
jgi:hypothetical protein